MKKHILIVAGGKGSRMSNKLPKQFLLLKGKPILFYTINSFLFLSDVEFTLVLNSRYIDYWKKLCISHNFNIPHNIVEGGTTRFQSVKNGLSTISDDNLVLIHDAVRPFPSQQTINNVCKLAEIKGNAIPSVDITDSIREINEFDNRTVNRNTLKSIQTPQAFRAKIIKEAYNQEFNYSFTDDASVLESVGKSINLVDGNAENIKISNPIDMIFAEGIIEKSI